MKIKIPYFDEKNYTDNEINSSSRVVNITNVDACSFYSYCELFENKGTEKKEYIIKPGHYYAAFYDGNIGIFLNFFENLRELNIVTEKNCRYFSYEDKALKKKVLPQITQVHLVDFAMSYAIRLSDGRFIVIDGGWNFQPDAESLFDVLKNGSLWEKPIIAAWIMTHAHCDHYRCFNEFIAKYCNDVVIEKFLFNFPFAEKFKKEKFANRRFDIKQDYCFENSSDFAHINIMYDNIKKTGCDVYMPHTGQSYQIGDAVLEFLSTIDDTHYLSCEENSSSLVFKMELGSQVILWTGDASFSDSRLYDKYGNYLKADILQVPHHGFGSGAAEEQIRCYELIKPEVCLLPVSDYHAYTAICTYVESTRYLMTGAGIKELITGDKTVTLNLPYKTNENGVNTLKEKYKNGLKNTGSAVWVFTGLNSSVIEDFKFTILNMTHFPADVHAEIYFEDSGNRITGIKAEIPEYSFKTVNITDENDVELNSSFFNWNSIGVKGVPENVPFAVRFLSSTPLVISNSSHPAAYRG